MFGKNRSFSKFAASSSLSSSSPSLLRPYSRNAFTKLEPLSVMVVKIFAVLRLEELFISPISCAIFRPNVRQKLFYMLTQLTFFESFYQASDMYSPRSSYGYQTTCLLWCKNTSLSTCHHESQPSCYCNTHPVFHCGFPAHDTKTSAAKQIFKRFLLDNGNWKSRIYNSTDQFLSNAACEVLFSDGLCLLFIYLAWTSVWRTFKWDIKFDVTSPKPVIVFPHVAQVAFVLPFEVCNEN